MSKENSCAPTPLVMQRTELITGLVCTLKKQSCESKLNDPIVCKEK